MSTPAPALDTAFLTRPLAHRGLHDKSAGRPENSPAGFRAAIAGGYGIELDLQLSLDGRAMVFHDYDLRRLTGESGPIQMRTAADLGAMPLLGGTEGVPTLQQVLALVQGRVPLLIEIKDQSGILGGAVGRLEQAAANDLRAYSGPVALMSFNPHSVQKMAGLAPHTPRGLTTDAFDPDEWSFVPAATLKRLRDIPDYDALGASFISHDQHDLTRPRVSDLRNRGANILCWTIRSQAEESAARRIAQNITFEGYTPQ
jgi:glycerophosphoryl diester phosphodiesterase